MFKKYKGEKWKIEVVRVLVISSVKYFFFNSFCPSLLVLTEAGQNFRFRGSPRVLALNFSPVIRLSVVTGWPRKVVYSELRDVPWRAVLARRGRPGHRYIKLRERNTHAHTHTHTPIVEKEAPARGWPRHYRAKPERRQLMNNQKFN